MTEVNIPVGADNRLSRYSANLGQPTSFTPGNNPAAFAVVFDGLPLSWSVAGQRVTAWANHPVNCDRQQIVPVRPAVSCVSHNANGSYSVRFGYRNDNAFNVAIPVQWRNLFIPEPIRRGQPVIFEPGRFDNVFTVNFPRGAVIWMLDGRLAIATPAPIQACR